MSITAARCLVHTQKKKKIDRIYYAYCKTCIEFLCSMDLECSKSFIDILLTLVCFVARAYVGLLLVHNSLVTSYKSYHSPAYCQPAEV